MLNRPALNRKTAYFLMSGIALAIFVILLTLLYFNSNSITSPVNSLDFFEEGLIENINRPQKVLTTWVDSQQILHSLDDHLGKVIYINYWAIWCEPCVQEIPFFSELLNSINSKDFIFLLVNFDQEEVEIKKAQDFMNKNNFNLLSIYKQSSVFKKNFPTEVLPSHFILDKKGRLAAQFYGDILDKKNEISKTINNLLNEDI